MQTYRAKFFFFISILKGLIIIKDKQEKWHRKFLLQIYFFAKIFTDARVKSITFFGFARYLPMPELEILVGIVH
jgi:uncharacterized membrane protein YozB (DUF420 family)